MCRFVTDIKYHVNCLPKNLKRSIERPLWPYKSILMGSRPARESYAAHYGPPIHATHVTSGRSASEWAHVPRIDLCTESINGLPVAMLKL